MFNKMKSAALILALSALLVASAGAAGDELRIHDSTVVFRHFAYELNPDRTMLACDPGRIVETVFKTIIMENKYLKVTLLPEYGGRILSIIYKPTGREQLYQNPVGTPYGMGEGNFYYNWLMVYGGIFPTFPEPEHGKTWCLPWSARVVARTPDLIGVEMAYRDTIEPARGVPRRFNKGRTDLACAATVWLHRDKPYVRLGMRLENTRDEPVDYEYWTCATLAPGSTPGRTFCPGNTEIIAAISRVKAKDDWWRWMAAVDEPAGAPHVFAFKNLATFANWADMGIAYAYPRVEGSFWGAINHANEEGLIRVADNSVTPGLKLWTWGYRQGSVTDPETFGNSARPYIELWAGHSLEFFQNATLAARAIVTWDEYYIPTAGLPKVTFANEHALIHLHHSGDGNGGHTFAAKVFTTRPGEAMDLLLRLRRTEDHELYRGRFIAAAGETCAIEAAKAAGSFDPGHYAYELILTAESGEILARAEIPVEVE